MADEQPGAAIEDYLLEDRTFPPPEAFKEDTSSPRRSSTTRPTRTARASGPARPPTSSTGTRTGTRSSSGTCRSPSGSWAGSSTSATTPSTATSLAGRGDKVAYHWEGEPGDTRTITYADLHADVQRFANVLKGLGVAKGDRVCIYMPMVPELPVAMLACARIGAPHSVVFGGFSPDSLIDRINDAECKVVITADGGFRRGAPSMLKPNVDTALASTPTRRARRRRQAGRRAGRHGGRAATTGGTTSMETADAECPCEPMDSEDLLYLLYTSGTTAKPKGIMHTTGGYLTQVAFTHKYVFDLHPDNDVYWCAADIGWVTGHSYIVYGPLTNGATSVIYEGTPDTPGRTASGTSPSATASRSSTPRPPPSGPS